MPPRSETGRPVPLLDLYNKGFMTKRELRAKTLFQRAYFRKVGIAHMHSDVPIEKYFKDTGAVFLSEGEVKKGKKKYRIDPEVMNAFLPELKLVVEEARNERYPKRTEEERRAFEAKILRKMENGKSVPISFEEAYEIVMDYGIKFLLSRSVSYGDAEDLAADSLMRVMPHLRGDRGDFENILHFCKGYFATTLTHMSVDKFREGQRENGLHAQTRVHIRKTKTDSREKAGMGFRRLTKEEELELRYQLTRKYGLNDSEIEMMVLRMEGFGLRNVAWALGISYHTAKKKSEFIQKKLRGNLGKRRADGIERS